jgi:bifunctional non-homologous end joining protein LigD
LDKITAIYEQENLIAIRLANDGRERQNSVRFARLDFRNQARWLPGDHRFRYFRQTSPLVAQWLAIGTEIPGDLQSRFQVDAEGKSLFELTKKKGIIAKRKDSLYRPGKRSSDWLKIKARLQQEFVVGGFTAPKGSRKYLGAVVLGAYTGGKLRHYGYAGSGFSEKGLKDAVERMKPLFTDKSPFVNPPNIKEKIQWVQPKLVCEIEYAELTADEQLRQTTFLGWRDDKKPKDVILELH